MPTESVIVVTAIILVLAIFSATLVGVDFYAHSRLQS
jgi:archaellin